MHGGRIIAGLFARELERAYGDPDFHFSRLTIDLHRLPVGEWLGWEVATHQSDAGVAVGGCTIYDQQGPIGTSTVCAVSSARSG